MVEAFFGGLEGNVVNKTPDKQAAIGRAKHTLLETGVEVSPLTAKDQQIIQYAANGFDDEEIAQSFGISPRTVGTHFSNIHRKLGAHSRAEVMIIGVKRKIIDLDQAAEGQNLELVNGLTGREIEVLKVMVEKQTSSSEEIAKALSIETKKISPRTVGTHRAGLLLQLDVSSMDQALIIFMTAERKEILAKIEEEKRLAKLSAKTELTPREKSILQLSAKGLSDKTIAQQLNIAPRTVDAHKTNIRKKLGVHTLAEMIIRGVNKGLIDIEECVDEETRLRANEIMNLTGKEQEVLEKMVELQITNYKAVGKAMDINSRTVETHIRHLMKKLGLHSIDRVLALYMFHQKTQTNSQSPQSPS